MSEISGDFETHVTVQAHQRDALDAFAAEHALKVVHIELDRGDISHQPMLTLHGSGTLAEQIRVAGEWCDRLGQAGMRPARVKVEAAPYAAGVPVADRDAAGEPQDRYFEHHVKVLLPAGAGVAGLLELTDLAVAFGARLSRNARSRDAAGTQARFVNQRCWGVGRETSTARLGELVDGLRAAGYEIAKVEQEYVVHDSHLDLDLGWLQPPRQADAWGRKNNDWLTKRDDANRQAPAGQPGYPPTYQPLPSAPGLRQRAAFDPAVKPYPHAFRPGEPVFTDPVLGQRWRDARRTAMQDLLTAIAASRWSAHLVLRGSVTMPAWVGEAAREPGDLDFVVTPPTLTSDSTEARQLLDGILACAGLQPGEAAESAIWTYERADGHRLAIPFDALHARGALDEGSHGGSALRGGAALPGGEGSRGDAVSRRGGGRGSRRPARGSRRSVDELGGSLQVDVVFGERLPVDPLPVTLPGVGVPVQAATAGLSLAWKLQWLGTDMWPQGKDLYDAVLLAEHTPVDLNLVRELLSDPTFGPETVLSWIDVDWDNLAAEHPIIEGDVERWVRRLAIALDR
ncbi:nucleotidyl transferase AbiEii/AbiGii toxin family protein [Winogradskya humida]|uniref:Nucleotidyltransferase AbiEii toxin of type IV toxin-antitoxin system n=1 Tax=Winogradskya humida TaxID=113566 RepID=A0ABQ3ZYL4_9ACTN|nr:nucleotidyl transferase AbiEii/AbiGii toxin family protein [Actinoplanes humidus]GIE23691.1 hypothetical protein Ahu01nite_067930 [Actinoplanes humidus]